MIETDNIENEFKITSDADGFDVARAWLKETFGTQYGTRTYTRSCIYFDTPDRKLLKTDVTFRRNKNKLKYCLKIPISIDKKRVVRREYFLTLFDGPINILDPFDRVYSPVRRLIPYICGGESPSRDHLLELQQVLSIKSSREFFPVFSKDGNRMINVALDYCIAKSTGDGSNGIEVSWHEIEVETNQNCAEYNGFAESTSNKLRRLLGSHFQTLSKYCVAHDLLFAPLCSV